MAKNPNSSRASAESRTEAPMIAGGYSYAASTTPDVTGAGGLRGERPCGHRKGEAFNTSVVSPRSVALPFTTDSALAGTSITRTLSSL